MSTERCAYCSEPAACRKIVPGGYAIPVCEDCLAEDRREHDDPEPIGDDDGTPEVA
jgi:hypothetical protein